MAFQTISTPQLQVNDVTYAFVPNSVMIDTGKPEIGVKVASTGGGAVQSVHSTNIETAKGKVKFELFSTSDAISVHQQWKDDIGQNNISLVQRLANGDSVTLSFGNMSLTNQIEWNLTPDGTNSFEWEGDPMVEI